MFKNSYFSCLSGQMWCWIFIFRVTIFHLDLHFFTDFSLESAQNALFSLIFGPFWPILGLFWPKFTVFHFKSGSSVYFAGSSVNKGFILGRVYKMRYYNTLSKPILIPKPQKKKNPAVCTCGINDFILDSFTSFTHHMSYLFSYYLS